MTTLSSKNMQRENKHKNLGHYSIFNKSAKLQNTVQDLHKIIVRSNMPDQQAISDSIHTNLIPPND